MAHHAIKRLGPTGLIAIFVAIAVSMLAMAAGTASATTEKKKSPAAATAAAPKGDDYSADVTGTTNDGRDVAGTFTPRKFQKVGKKVVAKGVLEGTISGGNKAPRTFKRSVSMPVAVEHHVADSGVGGGGRMAPAAAPAAVTCDVLNLVLGPLDLNLLGLEIHLDTVVLDIIANPAGGLLGQLLCAVANLLSGGPLAGLLRQLADVLNQILGQLNTP